MQGIIYIYIKFCGKITMTNIFYFFYIIPRYQNITISMQGVTRSSTEYEMQ